MRVDQAGRAHLVKGRALVGGQRQRGSAQVVAELLLGTRPDDQRGHRRPAQQPGERDLGRRGARARSPRRPAPRSCRRASPGHEPAAQSHSPDSCLVCPSPGVAPRRYLPDTRPPASGDHTRMPSPWSTESGTQLVLGVPRLERVVDLLGREPLVAAAVGRPRAPSSAASPRSSTPPGSAPSPPRPASRARTGSPRAGSARPTRARGRCRCDRCRACAGWPRSRR